MQTIEQGLNESGYEWSVIGTGGNCDAIRVDLGTAGYLLITAANDPSVPVAPRWNSVTQEVDGDDYVMVGHYIDGPDTDGTVGGCEPVDYWQVPYSVTVDAVRSILFLHYGR